MKTTPDNETRRGILRAALKRFANCGYAAASVQQIVGDAKVSKPTLYYYFSDKAALFGALVYSVVFFPALLALFVPPAKSHGPRYMEHETEWYKRALPWALRYKVVLLAVATLALTGAGVLIAARKSALWMSNAVEKNAMLSRADSACSSSYSARPNSSASRCSP